MTRIPPLKHEWDCSSCAALEAEIVRLTAAVKVIRPELEHMEAVETIAEDVTTPRLRALRTLLALKDTKLQAADQNKDQHDHE